MARKYIRYVTKNKLEKVSEKNKKLIRKYFNFKNMNLSDSSKKSYESDFNQWLVYINEKYREGALDEEHILDIIEEDIEEMVDLLEDYIAFCTSVLGNNERRVQRRMASISSFFLYLRKKRKIKENPVSFLERPSVSAGDKPQIQQTFLDKKQVDKIRKGLKKMNNIQLELYFEMSISTMARVNAISNIELEQIDFKGRRIVNVKEKEGKEVTLFFSKRSLHLIEKLLKYRKSNNIDSKYLFITKYGGKWKKATKGAIQSGWIKKIGEIIDVPELHAHDLRHSGSNLLYHSGMSLENVSKLLNHSGTEVTQNHYLQMNYDKIQEEKDAFEV
jgi:integrase/recombinase XerC